MLLNNGTLYSLIRLERTCPLADNACIVSYLTKIKITYMYNNNYYLRT